MLKFLVLSDLHLVEEGETSHGLDTYWRLEQGIETINTRYSDADFCVLAGDLADKGFEGATAPYDRLKELVDRLTIPCHITIGITTSAMPSWRHLARKPGLRPAISTRSSTQRAIAPSCSIPCWPMMSKSITMAASWRSLSLTGSRRGWREHAGPVVVVLHHHANPLMTMVDRIKLENGAALAEVLNSHGDVRQVIAGHVHYTSTALWHGIPFTTLAGSHYSVTAPVDGSKPDRLWGSAQLALVLGTEDQSLIHFDNYLDGNTRLG